MSGKLKVFRFPYIFDFKRRHKDIKSKQINDGEEKGIIYIFPM